MRWIIQEVEQRGAKTTAELIDYAAANLAKVITGKRKLSKQLRNRIGT
jgi:hypothetical protein